jgi:hypothetical protein
MAEILASGCSYGNGAGDDLRVSLNVASPLRVSMHEEGGKTKGKKGGRGERT